MKVVKLLKKKTKPKSFANEWNSSIKYLIRSWYDAKQTKPDQIIFPFNLE